LKDVLAKIINRAVELGADYSEIRAQTLHKTMLTIKEGRVEATKQGVEEGSAIRVLVRGSWGFASTGSFESERLREAITEACKMARAASLRSKEPVKLSEAKPVEAKVTLRPKIDPSAVPVEEKIETAIKTNDAVMKYDKRIRSCTVTYLDITGQDHFVNSDSAYIEQDKLYVWLAIGATARQNDVFTFSRESVGTTAGYELFDVESPEKMGTVAAKRAVDQLEAKPPKGGTFPAVLAPNVVGTFVHEAFGHLAEADLTLSGSVLSGKLGKKLASEMVTLYDDGTIEGAFGSFKYDDEGIPSQKTMLVKDGVVVGLMHNRETARKFGAEPTGNARAESFRVEPIIRMRNTIIAPKDFSFEEMIEDIKFGYYLKSVRGGEANLDGTFQVGIQEAYEIVKGEIGRGVRNASISGNTLETLHRVDAVGKEFELWPGVCGKGQAAFVCDGGGHTRVKEVLVGGSA